MPKILDFNLTETERLSIILTLALTLIAIIVSSISIVTRNYFLLAISMGSIGGLVHEFVQSGGKILFIKKQDDGFYLGSISGMFLGSVAGVLVIKGQLMGLETSNINGLAIDVFLLA